MGVVAGGRKVICLLNHCCFTLLPTGISLQIPINWLLIRIHRVQGCTSTSDIVHKPIEFEKCPFDFSVERTNVLLLSCFVRPRFEKHRCSRLRLASLTLRRPLSGAGSQCRIAGREQLGFRVVAINIADCGLGGTVLNLVLRRGKKQNKRALEQFATLPKKKT